MSSDTELSPVFQTRDGSSSAIADFRPILVRNTQNVWSRAEESRDKLYELFSESVRAERVDVLVLKSAPFVFPAWVQIAAWVPQNEPNCSERRWVKVSLETKPYHEHQIEYSVQHSKRAAAKTIPRTRPFHAVIATQLVRYTVGRGPMPSLPRFRSSPLELWRPANRLKVVRTDLVAAAAGMLTILGAVALLSGLTQGALFFAAALATIIGVFLGLRVAKRPYIVRCQGKPKTEPRRLARVDSWQTVIFGAGAEVTDFRRRFEEILETPPTDNFSYAAEKVWYWGVDGKEEREQIVLTAGRAIVFCQLYRYGNDLYIGWDGHVNYGQWTEATVARGLDRSLGLPVAIAIVEPGVQDISEYDLIDLSCLMEWTHAQLSNLAKRLLQELKIDQEIDFNILRGERQGLTGAQEEPAKKKETRRKALSFRRTA